MNNPFPCADKVDLFFSPKTADVEAAKRICHDECRWRAACLANALARGEVEHGVFGGLAPVERRLYARQLRVVDGQLTPINMGDSATR